MTRDDLFKINAGIVRDLVKGVADVSPKAFILVISNPVNSTVPVAAEVLKQANVYDPKRLFGVTTLDVVRAETFVQELSGEKDPAKTVIPVIGGHSGETIVPLFSLATPKVTIPGDKYEALVKRMFSFPPLPFGCRLLKPSKVCNLVGTRLFRPKEVLVPQHYLWRTQGFGRFYVTQ